MDCVILLNEARRAGLFVRVEGDRLVVRGPRSAQAVAERVLERKDEILAALRIERIPKGPYKGFWRKVEPQTSEGKA